MPSATNTRRVLVADDAPDSQMLLALRLERLGARVSVAEDGQAAIDHVEEATRRGEPFDVILMDMQMPNVDGYKAVALLRANGYERRIVALTGGDDREACLRVGCDDHLAKPLSAVDLISILENDIASPASRVADDAPANMFDGDIEATLLLARFVETLREDALALELALHEDDYDLIRKIAHRLKGTAGSYGYDAITAVAHIVEEAARDRSPHASSRCRELMAMCARSRVASR
jgi:CheY-like chemotaxis protein